MIVVAPGAFKGSLTAAEVAAAVAVELRRVAGDEAVLEVPVADGGDGTVDVAVASGMERVDVTVSGPLGEPVGASYAVEGDTALVELANASGLALLSDGPDRSTARAASTRGLGELVRHAVERGARTVVVGLGGSATTDGGAGLAQALGAAVRARDGTAVPPGGAGLTQAASVDLDPLRELLDGVDVVLASDVDNPLLGPQGAAAVYGPQKGADAATVRELDDALRHFNELLVEDTGLDNSELAGAGAAGGAGLPLLAAAGARIRPGLRVLAGLTGLDDRLARARLVVVGEGRLDGQSLRGKGPVEVARTAKAAGAEVVAVVGTSDLDDDELADAAIDRVHAMTDVEPDLDTCIREAPAVLQRLATRLATSEAERWRTTSRDRDVR